jgi:hypothetical protein
MERVAFVTRGGCVVQSTVTAREVVFSVSRHAAGPVYPVVQVILVPLQPPGQPVAPADRRVVGAFSSSPSVDSIGVIVDGSNAAVHLPVYLFHPECKTLEQWRPLYMQLKWHVVVRTVTRGALVCVFASTICAADLFLWDGKPINVVCNQTRGWSVRVSRVGALVPRFSPCDTSVSSPVSRPVPAIAVRDAEGSDRSVTQYGGRDRLTWLLPITVPALDTVPSKMTRDHFYSTRAALRKMASALVPLPLTAQVTASVSATWMQWAGTSDRQETDALQTLRSVALYNHLALIEAWCAATAFSRERSVSRDGDAVAGVPWALSGRHGGKSALHASPGADHLGVTAAAWHAQARVGFVYTDEIILGDVSRMNPRQHAQLRYFATRATGNVGYAMHAANADAASFKSISLVYCTVGCVARQFEEVQGGVGTGPESRVRLFLCLPCGRERGGVTTATLPPLFFVIGSNAVLPFLCAERGRLTFDGRRLADVQVSWRTQTVLAPGSHYSMEDCDSFVSLGSVTGTDVAESAASADPRAYRR